MLTTHLESQVIETSRSSYRAYKILYYGFIALPILAGADKFFNLLTNWSQYLSPVISRSMNAVVFMRIVGVVEIAAAILVLTKPRLGSLVVGFWLLGIVINLLTVSYYDIALRDFGLALAAFALANLSQEYSE